MTMQGRGLRTFERERPSRGRDRLGNQAGNEQQGDDSIQRIHHGLSLDFMLYGSAIQWNKRPKRRGWKTQLPPRSQARETVMSMEWSGTASRSARGMRMRPA